MYQILAMNKSNNITIAVIPDYRRKLQNQKYPFEIKNNFQRVSEGIMLLDIPATKMNGK